MRIAHGCTIDDLPDGGVRLRAADWPWAAWFAAPLLLVGLPLVAWSAATSNWIELGGGVVFCAFGALAAWLAAAKRRDFEIRGTGTGVSVRGDEGALSFRRSVAPATAATARLEIRAFPVPDGAPALPDRGGDLVIAADGAEILLVRRVGPSWRRDAEAARTLLIARIPALG